MKILLDIDIIIQRESRKNKDLFINAIFQWLQYLGYEICILQQVIDEINESLKINTINSFVEYVKLENSLMSPDVDAVWSLYKTSYIQKLMINELYLGNVDFFITEDKTLSTVLNLLNLNDKVYSISDFFKLNQSEHIDLIDSALLNIKKIQFAEVNVNDSIFDSLREDYEGFNNWFICKSKVNTSAYVTYNANHELLSFLYLKIEGVTEDYSDIKPIFKPKKRLKIGTFKIINRGIRLSERFFKIIFDYAFQNRVEEIYITILNKREEQQLLIKLLESWGFYCQGRKGEEYVYVRNFKPQFDENSMLMTYPYVSRKVNKFLVSLRLNYHEKIFSKNIFNDIQLKERKQHICINCIKKSFIIPIVKLPIRKGDILIFYCACGDSSKSYISTLCIVSEIHNKFKNKEDCREYVNKHSSFSESELINLESHTSKKVLVIDVLYIYSFPYKLTLLEMIKSGILLNCKDVPRGFKLLTNQQFDLILKETKSDERYFVD